MILKNGKLRSPEIFLEALKNPKQNFLSAEMNSKRRGKIYNVSERRVKLKPEMCVSEPMLCGGKMLVFYCLMVKGVDLQAGWGGQAVTSVCDQLFDGRF